MPACESTVDADADDIQHTAEEETENVNEETAEDIERQDDKNTDNENAAAADADKEADEEADEAKNGEDSEEAEDEAAVWEVSSSSPSHAGPASGSGGGVSSRLRPLRSRLRCSA